MAMMSSLHVESLAITQQHVFVPRVQTGNWNEGSSSKLFDAVLDGSEQFKASSGRSPLAQQHAEDFLKCLNTLPDYQARKDRNPARVANTCEWFLSHKVFLNWRQSPSSTLLWVSADPGCGKSVLVKHLAESFLAERKENQTVAYFFFKDDYDDQKDASEALRCLLYQILMQRSALLTDNLLHRFHVEGKQLTRSLTPLWDILMEISHDKNAGEIICFLDAVDECRGKEWSLLAEKLRTFYDRSGRRGGSNLKILLTSRPYSQIRHGLEPFVMPVIHLGGENEAEVARISKEIDLVIKYRVDKLRAAWSFSDTERAELLKHLSSNPNRTYLWVTLILDLIERTFIANKGWRRVIKLATSQLPKTVDDAYERILSASRNPEIAKRALHIIVAAARPLALSEMAAALALKEDSKFFRDLIIESPDDFKGYLRGLCGLFVVVIDSKIYLLHQTAKEFLVKNATVWPGLSGPVVGRRRWRHSLDPQESHRVLAEICIWRLLLKDFGSGSIYDWGLKSSPRSMPPRLPSGQARRKRHFASLLLGLGSDLPARFDQIAEGSGFLDYPAQYWAYHLRQSSTKAQERMREQAMKLCNSAEWENFQLWVHFKRRQTREVPVGQNLTTLVVAAYLGLAVVVKHLIRTDGVDLDARDKTYGRSALSWASKVGHEDVVKLLTKGHSSGGKRVDINLADIDGRTPLLHAAMAGNTNIARRLIAAGAKVDAQDKLHATPLIYATCRGNKEMVRLLTENGANTERGQDVAGNLLMSSILQSEVAIVRMLLENNELDLQEVKDKRGRMPLQLAAEKGNDEVVKLLLATDKAAPITPEVIEAAAGRLNAETMARILEKSGTNVEITDKVLRRAARKGNEGTMEFLLRKMLDGVPIAEKAATAPVGPVGNRRDAERVLESIFAKKMNGDSDQTAKVAEKLIVGALNSDRDAGPLLEMLFEKKGDQIIITEEIIGAAMRSHLRSKDSGGCRGVLKLLLEKASAQSSPVDARVMELLKHSIVIG